jgi:AmiR/NasT family two-component response regulator
MRRVLIGEFGEVPAMALRHLLEQEGLTVVGEAAAEEEIVALVGEVRPDVLLLDLDDARTEDIAVAAGARLSTLTVIAWSSAEPVMRVFPPGQGKSQTSPLTFGRLAAALKASAGPVDA